MRIQLKLIGTMRFDVITLFPEIVEAMTQSIVGKAVEKKLISIHCHNPRDYSSYPHKQVDDKPYGGGPGMVLQYEPIVKTLENIKKNTSFQNNQRLVVYLSPSGKLFKQSYIQHFKSFQQIIFISGKYEGIDQRIIDHHVDEVWSVGPYVLSGGELPSCIMIDSISRSIKGVLGNEASFNQDFDASDYDTNYPVYTRPEIIDGHEVPKILLSGHHAKIKAWLKDKKCPRSNENDQ